MSSIKGEVKKKHFTHGRMFFCTPARPVEQDCSSLPLHVLGSLHTVTGHLVDQRFTSSGSARYARVALLGFRLETWYWMRQHSAQ